MENNNLLIAFVGMPGSGKTEATLYLQKKEIPFVRFGDITEEKLEEKNMPVTPENERIVREQLRKDFGMAAYALHAEPRIRKALEQHKTVVLDGLYSWGEYIYLKEKFTQLVLIHVYARPTIRYARLAKRPVRPLTNEEAKLRDRAEIEKLDKGGPIAIADYMIENNSDAITDLYNKLDNLLETVHV